MLTTELVHRHATATILLMKSLSVTLLAVSFSVSTALTGCGSDDAADSADSTSSATHSGAPSPSDDTPDLKTTDATAVCTEVSTKVGKLAQQALEDIDAEGKSTKAYNKIADAYEAGAEKLEDQKAKDTFQELADINRDIAEGGPSAVDSDRQNKAFEDFGKVCFDA